MEKQFEHIPSAIFDWLGKQDFATLTRQQQAEVLHHFTAAEYDQMHEVVAAVQAARQRPSGKARIRETLLHRFDAKHQPPAKVISLARKPVALWKAAAAFVLFTSSLLVYHSMSSGRAIPPALLADADTVYVTREVPSAPVRVYDTVYIDREVRPARATYAGGRHHTPAKTTEAASDAGIPVLSITELERSPNMPKGNSMKEDSLLRKYGFVTL